MLLLLTCMAAIVTSAGADDGSVAATIGDVVGVPTHPGYPGVALDFWRADDPSYGHKWGNSSALLLDLDDPTLVALASSLAPGILRIGGSPEDSIVFDVDGTCAPNGTAAPNPGYACAGTQLHPWVYVYDCLTPARWEALLAFGARTGLRVVFGLNGCYGRTSKSTSMDLSNIEALVAATAASPHARKGFYGFEFTNEIFGYGPISSAAWGADAAAVRRLLEHAFPRGETPPLMGADSTKVGALASVPPGTLHALTYHEYPECRFGIPNTSTWAVLPPACLAGVDRTAERYAVEAAAAAPQPGNASVRVWSGEAADYGGGGLAITESFVGSFWYAWRLGALPALGVELAIKQTLVGGEYEMLQHGAGFAPNPDYWVAWLFKSLVGGGADALNVTTSVATNVSGVRVFAFMRSSGGTVAALLLNLNRVNGSAVHISGAGDRTALPRTEYHVTASAADWNPEVPHTKLSCNGIRLVPGPGTHLPPTLQSLGKPAVAGSAVSLAPASIVFVTFDS